MSGRPGEPEAHTLVPYITGLPYVPAHVAGHLANPSPEVRQKCRPCLRISSVVGPCVIHYVLLAQVLSTGYRWLAKVMYECHASPSANSAGRGAILLQLHGEVHPRRIERPRGILLTPRCGGSKWRLTLMDHHTCICPAEGHSETRPLPEFFFSTKAC